MSVNSLPKCIIAIGVLGILGCGGEDVADQERFQMDTPPDVMIGNQIRAEVDDLAESLSEEGGEGLASVLQFAPENFEGLDTSALSEEDQAKVGQIKTMVNELAADASGAQEKIQQMQDLANQLPGGGGGGGGDGAE